MAIVDDALRLLSRSANKGRLWFGLAAVGAAMGGAHRRAAIRGAGSLAVSSAVVNIALKPVFRRRRPVLERTPVVRQLRRQPRSRSFPSGHAASAAAFATGVALERPKLGAAVGTLAAAVAYSRVHVGVHYRSDVIAGAALGAGIAVASGRWWPSGRKPPALIRRRRADGVTESRSQVVEGGLQVGRVRRVELDSFTRPGMVERQPDRM